jgi:hypothetical protein
MSVRLSARHRRIVALVSVGLAVAGTAGCGQSSPRAASSASVAASPSPASHLPSADEQACAGVQGVIGHIASGTSQWSPQLKPFDPAMSAQIARSAHDLALQGPQADSKKIQAAVSANAQAFTSLADAMKKKDRRAFNQAMTQTRSTYKVLKKTCSLG